MTPIHDVVKRLRAEFDVSLNSPRTTRQRTHQLQARRRHAIGMPSDMGLASSL